LASIGATGGAMAYNWLRALDMLGRLLREALWAPALIVAAALVLAHLPRAPDWWWFLHIAGGAAVAFCYLRAIHIAGPRLGVLRPAATYLLAFALSCTTALAWEIGEFTVDQLAGTTLQEGNFDTMSDLILGVAGAAAYLAARAIRNSRDAS
jgi:hypothetical protein